IGLGRMGGNMVKRLLGGGHEVVVFDRDPAAVERLAKEGATGASSLEDIVKKLRAPRAVWVMIPPGPPTESTIAELSRHMSANDIVIDGGNSRFKDSVRHAEELAKKNIRWLDVGTSGGIWGLEIGYSMMVGGDESAWQHVKPALETLAPKN